jgi:heme-NO-binding protein
LHGLVNRSIQRFVQETYGDEFWSDICRDAELGFENFESMLIYDHSQTEAVLASCCTLLDRSREGLLEDIGTFLISHPDFEALRRLLRFGGDNFEEFLHSLDDLQDRANLALPELDFPKLELRDYSANSYCLQYSWGQHGFGRNPAIPSRGS